MIPRDRAEKELRKLLGAEQDAALKEILGESLGYIIVYQRNGFELR